MPEILFFFVLVCDPPPGFQASCVPRMGDGAAASQLAGMAQRRGYLNRGFSNLWRGTPEMGCFRFVDSGYVYEDRNVLAAARNNNNPSFLEQCRQVQCLS